MCVSADELCALHKPFDASNLPAIIFAIMRNRPKPIPDEYSPALKETVRLLLSSDPAARPSIAEIEALPAVRAAIIRWRDTYRDLMLKEKGATGSSGSADGDSGASTASTGGAPSTLGSAGGGAFTYGAASLAGGSSGAAGGLGDAFQVIGADGSLAAAPFTPSGSSASGLVPPGLAASFAGLSGATPMSPGAGRQAAAAFERDMLRAVDAIAAEAESASGPGSAAAAGSASPLHARMAELQAALERGPPVSGKCWERLGRAWADSGEFTRAITAYRRSLRAKSANASLTAMEQLGNLLVRRAAQVCALAKGGDADGALKAADEALAGGSSSGTAGRGSAGGAGGAAGAGAGGGGIGAGSGGGDLLSRIAAKQARFGGMSPAGLSSAIAAAALTSGPPADASSTAGGAVGAPTTAGGTSGAGSQVYGSGAGSGSQVYGSAAGSGSQTHTGSQVYGSQVYAPAETPAWQRAAQVRIYIV